MKKKIILFDFDGVILDSFEAAFSTVRELDPAMSDEKSFRSYFDDNINSWRKGLSEEEINKGDKMFFKRYLPRLRRSKIFPGMKEVISVLSKKYRLIIISSSISSPIVEFIKKYNLTSCFCEIMGNDVRLYKTEKIKTVFKKYGVEAKDCVFITDTLGDMREAASVGVQSIGVSWGFQEKENMLKGKPLCIAEKPKDLLDIVSDYLNKN